MRARVPVLVLAVGFGLSPACSRPVTGRDTSSSILSDLQVKPEYVKAGVPIEFSFKVTGAPPASVTYDIAGNSGTCDPVHQGDDRFHCMHPGVNRDYMEGATLLVVTARDASNKSSVVTHPITIDFSCPHFLSLVVSPAIAQSGDTAVVTIEASKPLGEPPAVSRAGGAWETAAGQGQMWTVTHPVTLSDPQGYLDVTVRITDLAGNTSADCGADGQLKFAVDHAAPTVDISKVSMARDVPGTPSTIKADPMAFVDDVMVRAVRILDDTGTEMLAELVPMSDGSLPETSLGVQPKTRIQVQAVDGFGRTSPMLAVPERWRLSIGSGATPNAGIRVASRFSAAPPTSLSMRNRTAELAPDVFAADARAATVRTRIAFDKVGDLTSRYENVHHIISGYEPVGKTIMAVGGCRTTQPAMTPLCSHYDDWVYDVTLIQWDETEGSYIPSQGPTLQLLPQTSTVAPNARFGWNLASDGSGCATMFGGDSLYLGSDGFRNETIAGDVWQLCYAASGYAWRRIPVPDMVGANTVRRVAPLVYDPMNRRFVTMGGAGFGNPKALFLLPDPMPALWQWVEVTGLPSALPDRFENLLYYDTKVQGIVEGLGFPQDQGSGQQLQYWTYADGQWTLTSIPPDLSFRSYFGWAYDEARHQLALWGGEEPFQGLLMDAPEPEVWVLTGSSTSAPSAWRKTNLDHPVPRDWPSMVYDPDRQVIVVFGGIRANDVRVTPSEIQELVLQPSAPFLLATIDLAAERPKGIDRLHLTIRASGSGDADGLGPGVVPGFGVVVKLWDFTKNLWVDQATSSGGGIDQLEIEVTTRPEVYVGPNGTVPVTITPRYFSTEAVSGRLDVDLIDGYLDLRPGIALP